MTLKSLINFGNFGKAPWDTSIERYHSGEGGYHHGYHGYTINIAYLKRINIGKKLFCKLRLFEF